MATQVDGQLLAGEPRGLASRLPMPSERLLYGLVGVVGVLLLWQLAAATGIVPKTLMSSPLLIWDALVTDLGNGALWPHIETSLIEWALGIGISVGIGVPLGLAIGMFRRVDYVLSVLVSGIYSTPKAALAPMVILVAGLGMESKVIIVVLLTIFSILVSTVSGVHAVNPRHYDITRSFGASRWLTFQSVILPSTVPFILSGIRIGAGRALVGLVVAEFLASNEGIGYYISFNGTMLNTSRVMVGILLLGTFGIGMGEAVRLVEHRFDNWRAAIH